MSNYNCAFCRNPGATNERKYKGNFIYVMCDDCDARYKEYKQLGPKFAYCLCGDKPRELEISMADSEINASEVATQITKEIESDSKPYVSQTYQDFDKTINDESKKRRNKKVSNL